MNEPSVKMLGIKKKFPGVQALDGVDLTVYPGEVHALLGENGAGKSVLLKILLGALQKDEGEIYIDGQLVDITGPTQARDLGISAVYQDLKLAPAISVAENISLGQMPGKYGIVNKKELNEKAKRILKDLNIHVDVNTILSDLSIAKKQMVAIAKALAFNVKVLLLDEPTAMLTNEETKTLFETVKKLKQEGVAIVFVSHRLEEIFEICDNVTILRDGKLIGSYVVKDTTRDQMVTLMAGREVSEVYPKMETVAPGRELLTCHNLTCGKMFKDVSFSVREHEILGFYGLVGAGRTEVMRAVFGADPYNSGEVLVDGEVLRAKCAKDAINRGIALVPEDRHKQGVALRMSVKANVNMTNYRGVAKYGLVSSKKESDTADQYIKQLSVKTPNREQLLQNLSGGNQQKVSIAKWINKNQKILIFDEPTIGIDIGTKHEIYILMRELANAGKAIIFISSYMPELLGVCDRIAVMSNGRISGVLDKNEFDDNKILQLAFAEND